MDKHAVGRSAYHDVEQEHRHPTVPSGFVADRPVTSQAAATAVTCE